MNTDTTLKNMCLTSDLYKLPKKLRKLGENFTNKILENIG